MQTMIERKDKMSKRGLPNTSTTLTGWSDPVNSSKRPRYIGQVPGVPALTPQFIDRGAETNLNEENGNHTTVLTVIVPQEQQSRLNQHQYTFMVNVDKNRQVLKSLAQVNELLATIQFDVRHKAYKYFEDNGEYDHLTKAWIVDNIIPYGALAVKDSTAERSYINRGNSVYTVDCHGASILYDYWTNNKTRLATYSKLYFVLKKVQMTESYKFQTKISPGYYEDGRSIGVNNYAWQIIPFAKNGGHISVEDYTFKNEYGFDELGYYWYIGHVHEHQPTARTGAHKLRDEYTTARNTNSLYNVGEFSSMQVYLLKDRKCPLLMI